MKVTSKGQVTIPKHIRERLGIGPGSEVDFVEADEGVLVERSDAALERQKRLNRINRAIAKHRGTSVLGMTTDEYMALIRDPVVTNPTGR
jgi:AbrB family looped-hinge helix DNA binding protein